MWVPGWYKMKRTHTVLLWEFCPKAVKLLILGIVSITSYKISKEDTITGVTQILKEET
jgi:hypothetical protein